MPSRSVSDLDALGDRADIEIGQGTDFDGTGYFSLNATNTFSLANELTTRDINVDSTIDYTLAYDKAGHQTDDGKIYTYVYDAFGRLRQIKHRTTSALISEHTYNALGFRVGWHYDADADADVDTDDPWYWFAYDDQWRVVATFRDEDADPKEVFVHHAAGLGGWGDTPDDPLGVACVRRPLPGRLHRRGDRVDACKDRLLQAWVAF